MPKMDEGPCTLMRRVCQVGFGYVDIGPPFFNKATTSMQSVQALNEIDDEAFRLPIYSSIILTLNAATSDLDGSNVAA